MYFVSVLCWTNLALWLQETNKTYLLTDIVLAVRSQKDTLVQVWSSKSSPQSPNSTSPSCLLKLKFHGSIFLVTSSQISSRGCPQQVVRVGLVEFRERDTTKEQTGAALYTAADRRPTNQVSAWVARHARHADIRRILARKMLPWNFSLTAQQRPPNRSRRATASKQVFWCLSNWRWVWSSCLWFHRRTRASYVYNGCLVSYNVVLTPRIHSCVKFVGLPLATRATVE